VTNTSSGKKAAVAVEKRRLRNRSIRHSVKTHVVKAESAIAAKGESAQEKATVAVSSIDKAVSKGVIHKNKAARMKSQLTKKLNTATVNEIEQTQTSEE